MSNPQNHIDTANAAVAFVASLNAINYISNYEKLLIDKQQQQQQGRENLLLFPSTSQASVVAALAAAAATTPATSTKTTQQQQQFQQFQQHFTQQFQNHISQLRFDNNNNNSNNNTNNTKVQTTNTKNSTMNVVIMDENELPKDDSKCHACGDKSTGSHFGGISCESCKAFFRRSVQRNRWEEYKCSYNGECKMNTSTRKICQYCRYKRCLSIGMRPKWVLSDDERQQKYGSRRKKNKLLLQQQQEKQQQDQQKDEDENESVEVLDEKFYKYGIDAININNYKNITKYDQVLINKLTYAFYYSRQAHELDLNSVENKLQKFLSTINNSEKTDEYSKLIKLILANFMVEPVKRVITFAKLIPDFRQLIIEDQAALLRGSAMEIFICSSQNLFDKSSNSFLNIISKERNLPTTLSNDHQQKESSTSRINLDILRYIWSDEIFERTIKYLKSMADLNIDETTLILYIPLILFSPDRRDLINRERVLQIQNKYSILLYKYLFYKYNKQTHFIDQVYTKLLLKLIDLRDLDGLHRSILLDVVDSSQLELYSQAILKENKEKNDNVKNVSNGTCKKIKIEVNDDCDYQTTEESFNNSKDSCNSPSNSSMN